MDSWLLCILSLDISAQNYFPSFPSHVARDSDTTVPFSAGTNTAGRFQEVYDASGFIDLAGNRPLWIRASRFREDEAQVCHYAALLDSDRIKLLNFGAESMEGLFRRCPFRRINRRNVTVDYSRWLPVSERCQALVSDAEACLRDWGGFLDASLFEEALCWFNGGESECIQRLPVTRDGIKLGSHRVAMHTDDVAFLVTSFGNGLTSYENELRRLLDLLPIRAWQWMNIHHAEMRFVTLTK